MNDAALPYDFTPEDEQHMRHALGLAELGMNTTDPNPRVGCVVARGAQVLGEGWHEERTGLHETEFIETRRHWFSKTVRHDTNGNLNVLNLVEGRQAIVESPSGAFEPFAQAIAAVLPHLRLAGFDLGDGGGLRFSRRAGEVVALDDLSDSEHQGVLFALAFAYFGLSGSIILIDEPELHMHATARVRFLETLAALGRDNQILAATGAAELVSAAKPGHVIELSRRTATSAATNRPPEQSASRGVAEAPASPMPMLDPGTAEPATSSKPARVERPAPQDVPSYLRPLPIGGALSPAPPVFPPSPQQDNDGHGTMLTSAVSGPALPFVQPPPRGEDDGYETVQLEVGALGPALPFAPPGKRLARFDPQTGRALPEPIWVDLPGNER